MAHNKFGYRVYRVESQGGYRMLHIQIKRGLSLTTETRQ